MCYDDNARPPDPPGATGTARGEDLVLTADDGTRFAAFAAHPDAPNGAQILIYPDVRVTGDYNTGSDLFPEKEQDGYVVVNGRIGIRGPEQRWAIEVWAQNLFNEQYTQVAFNAPFQGAGTRAQIQQFGSPSATTIFSAFLAEPRTYGITGRFRF